MSNVAALFHIDATHWWVNTTPPLVVTHSLADCTSISDVKEGGREGGREDGGGVKKKVSDVFCSISADLASPLLAEGSREGVS